MGRHVAAFAATAGAAAATAVAYAGMLCGLAGLCACETALDVGSNDAGALYDAGCKAGTYVGTYSCTAGSGSPLQLSNGPIAITLAPAGPDTLALPPDASLSSVNAGTLGMSTLSGVLDCSTRRLTGVAGDVVFTSATFNGTLAGGGPFTATYDGDASPPALVDGVLNPSPSLGSACTWSATLE
jgi:hypothetical protein